MTTQREKRNIQQPVTLETREEGVKPVIQGYAALFNSETEIYSFYGSFKERIAPGAFQKSLSEGKRVVSLFNHDANLVLGSTSGGTLRLREDEKGLWMEVDPPDTQVGRDVVEYIRRGDVIGQSFMFTINEEEWIFGKNKGEQDMRIIKDVNLIECGPVLLPAYEETSVGLRSATDEAYEQARKEWEARNRPEEPITIVSPEPYLLKVRLLKARG